MPAEPARGRSSRGRTALLETPIVCLAGWLPSCLARLAARETLTRKKNPNPRDFSGTLLRTTEIPNIRYCVPLKSLISVTAYH